MRTSSGRAGGGDATVLKLHDPGDAEAIARVLDADPPYGSRLTV